MRNPINAETISKSILVLHTDFPLLTIGEHISHAVKGRDIYTMTDKELSDALAIYIIDDARSF